MCPPSLDRRTRETYIRFGKAVQGAGDEAVSGPRCVFCGSIEKMGKWCIKGTSLKVCDSCAPLRRQHLSELSSDIRDVFPTAPPMLPENPRARTA